MNEEIEKAMASYEATAIHRVELDSAVAAQRSAKSVAELMQAQERVRQVNVKIKAAEDEILAARGGVTGAQQ